MKKYICILVIFVIIFINGNNVFAADTITSTENGSNSASSNVTASYNASGASIVYINDGIGTLTMISKNSVIEKVANSRYTMRTAYGTENNDSAEYSTPRFSMKLNMSGKANKYFADNTVIGNVTVTLTE